MDTPQEKVASVGPDTRVEEHVAVNLSTQLTNHPSPGTHRARSRPPPGAHPARFSQLVHGGIITNKIERRKYHRLADWSTGKGFRLIPEISTLSC